MVELGYDDLGERAICSGSKSVAGMTTIFLSKYLGRHAKANTVDLDQMAPFSTLDQGFTASIVGVAFQFLSFVNNQKDVLIYCK